MSSIKFILISLMTSQVTGASLLEKLLESTINSAVCEARCGGLEDAREAQVCLEVCKMVTSDSEAAHVCGVASLCTGACQAGCGEAEEIGDIKLTSLQQDGCGLNWGVEAETEDRVIFIVSGLDGAGMISIVSSSLEERRLALTSAMRERFTVMTVLAVGAGGLEDIRTVDIEKIEAECEIRDVDTTTQAPVTRRAHTMESNTDVDIQMFLPQLSPEILICGLAGVIFFISILVITFISIRERLRPNKSSGVAFTKLEALPL